MSWQCCFLLICSLVCRSLTVNTVWKMNTTDKSVTHEEFIWDRRRNLHGQEVHVSFVMYKPFFFIEAGGCRPQQQYKSLPVKYANGTVANLTGESLFKIELLAEDMNFTTVCRSSKATSLRMTMGCWVGRVGEHCKTYFSG